MNELTRRRGMMVSKVPFDPILYDNGKISKSIVGFNFVGYKYGARFTQSIEPDHLLVLATSQYNYPGGRTFTSINPLPKSALGKTLIVTGYMQNRAAIKGGQSFVYAAISDSVVDDDSVRKPSESGAFINGIMKDWYSGDIPAKTDDTIPSVQFRIELPITKIGYLSVLSYKAYGGTNDVIFRKIWME